MRRLPLLLPLLAASAASAQTARAISVDTLRDVTQELSSDACYARHPVYPLNRTVGRVNMDMLNTLGHARELVITSAGKSAIEDSVRPLGAAQGRTITPEINPERGGYYRSDHSSFARLGVPMLDGNSGQNLVKGDRDRRVAI